MNFKSANQVVVGLSGGMNSGKSTALAFFQKCGAFTLSCDDLVREISARAEVQKKIEHLFGSAEKKFLAGKIFSSAPKRRRLEALLYPLLLAEIQKRLRHDAGAVRVVEVPLLFEKKWDSFFDFTLCVYARQSGIVKRLAARGISKTDFLKRCAAQFPAQQKAALADICLTNDGAPEELAEKVSAVYRALCKIYQDK